MNIKFFKKLSYCLAIGVPIANTYCLNLFYLKIISLFKNPLIFYIRALNLIFLVNLQINLLLSLTYLIHAYLIKKHQVYILKLILLQSLICFLIFLMIVYYVFFVFIIL